MENNLVETEISSGPHKGQTSKSSKSIKCDGEDIALSLFNTFELNNGSDIESFRKAFNMVKDGDGFKESSILTIHSSSLLALLCFFSVSPERPLTIGKDKYTEVMFEVKNVVIKDGRRLSNIDVMLVSKSENGSVRKLLFLESKFTEYVTHSSRVELASKYHEFYRILTNNIPDLKFQISNYYISHKDGRVSAFGLCCNDQYYLEGIKQAFSHLLGIATGPKDGNLYESYADYYNQAETIEFGTIVHDWNQSKFKKYNELYADTFKNENLSKIKEALKEIAPNHKIVDHLQIRTNLLTYKDIFKGFNLPGIIREAYRLDVINENSSFL